MKVRALLTLARSGTPVTRVRAFRDGRAAIRVAMTGAALDTGVLDALRHGDATLAELAARVEARDLDLLEAFLRVLQAHRLVSAASDRWRLAHGGRAVLEDDVVRAAYEGFADFHTDLYRHLGVQLGGAPARRDVLDRGDVIARLSTAMAPFVADSLRALVSSRRPERVLDVGCGAGEQLAVMLSAVPAARGVGVDPDAGALEVAVGTLAREGLSGRATLLGKDVRDVLADPADIGGEQDLVLLANVLYYLPDGDRAPLLRDLGNLLTPGGVLVVVTTVAEDAPFSRHFDLLLRTQEGGRMCLPSAGELSDLLVEAGLRPGPVRRIAPGEPLVMVVADRP